MSLSSCQHIFVETMSTLKAIQSDLKWLYDKLNNTFMVISYEPRREKTGFLHMRKQKHRSASRSSVVVQPGLCRTRSETLKTGFLTTSSFHIKLISKFVTRKHFHSKAHSPHDADFVRLEVN